MNDTWSSKPRQQLRNTLNTGVVWNHFTKTCVKMRIWWQYCLPLGEYVFIRDKGAHHINVNELSVHNTIPESVRNNSYTLGTLFIKRADVLPQDLVMSRSRQIWIWLFQSFWNSTGSSTADMPVKFQCDTTIITSNLVASRLHEVRRTVLRTFLLYTDRNVTYCLYCLLIW